MPPELNTVRLMAGAGPAPMLEAAAGWETFAAALDAQALSLARHLHSLGELWIGSSSERAIAAAMPMVVWLEAASTQAKLRAKQAAAQATAYTQALATTPSLPEIATNRITHAILSVTNFFGINAVPLALKEMDYFVHLWNQAAAAMEVYEAETAANTRFEKLEAMPQIVAGGTEWNGLVGAVAQIAAAAPKSGIADSALPLEQAATQIASQAGCSITQLIQPLHEAGSMSSPVVNFGGGHVAQEVAQAGMLQVSPLSNHPLAGGAGPSVGAGLIRADSLPGAGGSLAQTSQMADLINGSARSEVAPAAASDESAAVGAAAPLGVKGHSPHSNAYSRPVMALPEQLDDAPNDAEQYLDDRYEDW
ncbi:PPE family protein [Mycobacterium camsae]|uniref:PPE family protein n=1 Tax=Mycobacterium gordonae TaxID=1778 RepID=UPI0024027228|nr:PPE family protein [Mycobacterium gordonae]